MKKLIVIRGPLGVGKTTVATVLAQKLNAEYISLDHILDDNNLVTPDTDGIPLESFLTANTIIVDTASKSQSTYILDGCFYYQEQIEDLQKKFHEDVAIFTLLSNVETCIARDLKRQKSYGEDSTRYVYGVTTAIHAGVEIDTTDMSVDETVEIIMMNIERS